MNEENQIPDLPVYARLLPAPGQAWQHGYISASAGTGKTYTIENLLARLLMYQAQNLPPRTDGTRTELLWEEILLVTYTEKAAAEIRERVRRKLLELRDSLLDGRDYRDEQERLIRDNSSARQRLDVLLASFENARISTIHSFCQNTLKEFSFESREVLEQSLEEDRSGADKLVMTWFQGPFQALPESLRHRVLDCWTPGQILEITRDFLSFHRPGSGDRICLDAELYLEDREEGPRLLSRGDQNLSSPEPAGLSPAGTPPMDGPAWEKLQQNLREQFLGALESWRESGEAPGLRDQVEPWLKNSKGKAAGRRAFFQQLIQWGSQSPAPDWATSYRQLLDQADFIRWPQELLTKTIYNKLLQTAPSSQQILEVLKELLDREQRALRITLAQSLLDIARTWEKLQREQGKQSFEDMIRRTALALKAPDSPLRKALQKRYRFGLIDEFQDTNGDQWEIFRALFVEDQGREKNRILWMVGDPKQSIFSFQGAELQVCLDAFGDLSQNLGGMALSLDRNYRSHPSLVEAYNRLFLAPGAGEGGPLPSRNGQWFGLDQGALDYSPVEPGLQGEEAPALVSLSGGPLPDPWNQVQLLVDLDSASHGEKKNAPRKRRELARVCFQLMDSILSGRSGLGLREARKAGSPVRKIRESDICILVERHKEAQTLVSLLRQKGYLVTRGREGGLFQSREALDLILILEALLSFQDPRARKKAFLGIFFGFTEAELLAHPPEDPFWNGALALLDHWATMVQRGRWSVLLQGLYTREGVMDRILSGEEGLRSAAAHRKLRSYLIRILENEGLTLLEACIRLRDLRAERLVESEEEAAFHRETSQESLQVLTLHSSKGLEFPLVFHLGGSSGINHRREIRQFRRSGGLREFYLDSSDIKEEVHRREQEERRRLWYVGLTRAACFQLIPWWGKLNRVSGSAQQLLLEPASQSLFDLPKDQDSLLTPQGAAYSGENPESIPPVWARVRAEDLLEGDQESRTLDADPEDPTGQNTRPSVDPLDMDSLRAANIAGRRRIFTSYTQLFHRSPGGSTAHDSRPGAQDEDDTAGTVLPGPDNPESPADREYLPRGAATGNILHGILEELDFTLLKPQEEGGHFSGPEALLRAPTLRRLFEDQINRELPELAGKEKREGALGELAQWIWYALRTPFLLPDSGREFVLWKLDTKDRISEMEFHLALDPEGRLQPLGGAPPSATGKGFIKGYMDLVFQFDQSVYVLDWKSNRLEDYSPQGLERAMEDNGYLNQAALYNLALEEHLKPWQARGRDLRAAGALYLFLRGCQGTLQGGIWSRRAGDLQEIARQDLPPALENLIQYHEGPRT